MSDRALPCPSCSEPVEPAIWAPGSPHAGYQCGCGAHWYHRHERSGHRAPTGVAPAVVAERSRRAARHRADAEPL